MTKLRVIVAFRYFANAPKNVGKFYDIVPTDMLGCKF